jgi:amino acid transporter
MTKRKLKRQLGLLQIIMLGTAGTIAAEIFVLTGHAAGMAGPAAVFAVLLAGLLSYSIALNYCEMAVAYPVTGGAMTYVREAWGANVLSFLVGSFDCLSSTFYAALSAVGFAYSLQVFLPCAAHRAHGAGGGGRVYFGQRVGREPRGRRTDCVGRNLVGLLGNLYRGGVHLANGLSLADCDRRGMVHRAWRGRQLGADAGHHSAGL